MTYYQQLNVSPDASVQQIKEAYRRLAFEYHPDRNAGDPEAAEKMKAINEAYAVLSNPDKRRQYDAMFHQYGEGASERFRQSFSDQDIFRGSDIYQIFEEMARSFGLRGFDDIFKDFYGQGYRTFEFHRPGMSGKGVFFGGPLKMQKGPVRNPGLFGGLARNILHKVIGAYLPQRGTDLHDVIKVTPELARLGGPFAYLHRSRSKKLVVHIPPGIRDDQVIRLTGLGKEGTHGAEPGDLYLKVRIKKPLMQRLKGILEPTSASSKNNSE